jgi:predicted Zn-dependent protease
MALTRRQTLAGLVSLPLAGCQVSPGTGRQDFNLLSDDDERKMGHDAHPGVLRDFGGVYHDSKLSAYVAGIGSRLAAHSEIPGAEFRFTVLDSEVVNALSLPGGWIYVTRGLLALMGDEAELAGVLGHEIGHVTARHAAQRHSRATAANIGSTVLGVVLGAVGVPGMGQVAQIGSTFWLQGYSRDNEFEADGLGLRYMARSGYDPEAMAGMLEKLREQARLEALKTGRSPDGVDDTDFLATHPRTIDRVREAAREVGGTPHAGALGAERFLSAIDGMVYGDGSAGGVVRDGVFVHAGEGFRFEVPPGFRLINGPDQVVAKHPSGAAIVFDGIRWQGGDMVTFLSRSWAPEATLTGLEAMVVDGLPAAIAATRLQPQQDAPLDLRLVAIRFSGDTVYRFLFVTPQRAAGEVNVDPRHTAASFRRLSAEEQRAAQPLRIRMVTAGPRDTVEGLAARMAMAEWKTETFRVINGLRPDEQLRPGRKVKLVL